MKIAIQIELDSGGTITMNGEDLSAEDISEIFEMLHGHTVVSQWAGPDDQPKRSVETLHSPFLEGFNEGRPNEEVPDE